jgi:NAD(P)-dependent dehydrogenase (short-subunit alcohol dehydrogenase family)
VTKQVPQTVLITEAGIGFGRATALRLAASGFEVFATVSDPEQRKALAAEATGVGLHVLPLDLTDGDGIERAVAAVVAQAGGIDALVNNADADLRGFFEDVADDEVRRLFDVKVFGAMAVTQAVLPSMRASRRGRIVFISSAAGRAGAAKLSGYCAGQFALEGLGESLALELPPLGISVSLIEPGFVTTPEDASGGMSTDVARAVERALNARRPRLRYLVGGRAGTRASSGRPSSTPSARPARKRSETGERPAVLITGASSGLGLETAVHLAEHGFRVFATMRDLGRRRRLDAEAARRGVEVDVLQLDVTDTASVRSAVAAALEQAGAIYGLVNNAGIPLRGYFEDLAPDEIHQVFETNLFGAMALTRAVLPHLRAAGGGRIVMMDSIGGRIGSQGLSAYCATKFALEGFSEALALEMKPVGIDVILVEPGIVNTDIWGANRRPARKALDPTGPYYRWFQRSEELADRIVASAPNRPVDVARAVHEALSAPTPRLRYVVGRRARLLLRLRASLPGESFERLYFGAVMRRVTGGEPAGGA